MRIKWGLYYATKYYDKDHTLTNHDKTPLIVGHASDPISPAHTKQIDKAFEVMDPKRTIGSVWHNKVEFHVRIRSSTLRSD